MKDILDGVAAGFLIVSIALIIGSAAMLIYQAVGPATLLIVGLAIVFVLMLLWSISRFTHPEESS